MIEHYLLSTVQLDAIAHVIHVALENEGMFVNCEHATNRDLAMLDVTQQAMSEIYKYKDHDPYILILHFAEYQIPALNKAAKFTLAETFSLDLTFFDNRTHAIIAQNFPDFDKRQPSKSGRFWVIPEGPKIVPDPV